MATHIFPTQILGLIGGGNMSKAIMFTLFKQGIVNPNNVIVTAKTQATLDIWKAEGCEVSLDPNQVLERANIVLWAVKPQVFPLVLATISKTPKPKTLHISMMAGVSLEDFCLSLKIAPEGRFIRIMPNLGHQVSCGVVVYTCHSGCIPDDKRVIESMFMPIGLCHEVQDAQINAYCALSGSGVGFMFPIMEALSDGAVKMGIPRVISMEIAAQVMKAAGEMYLRNKIHPAAMKDMVCSPGGTTIAGIAELEKGGVRSTVISAVEAATKRGTELGQLVPKK